MKFIFANLILLASLSAFALGNFTPTGDATQPFELLQPGYGATAKFADGQSSIIAGQPSADGTFRGQSVSPQAFFDGMVFGLDTNSFAVHNGILYSKGLNNGGSYVFLTTNLMPIFQGGFNFTNTPRLIVAAVPSFVHATLSGISSVSTRGMMPPSSPQVQISTDGGVSWIYSIATNVPCLVSLYDLGAGSMGNIDTVSNVTVFSYVNTASIGQTNDLTRQTVLLDTTADLKSAVNVGSAQTISAAATTLWANSPAVAAVDLAGNDLICSPDWTVSFTNNSVGWKFRGKNSLVLTPPISSNAVPTFLSITKAGTNLTLTLASLAPPFVQWKSDLAAGWTNLPNQSCAQGMATWTVTAPAPQTENAYFRAYTTLTAAPASLTFDGIITAGGSGLVFTNAAGKKFSIVVNASTNGFTFVARP